jgi:hypothetical protein
MVKMVLAGLVLALGLGLVSAVDAWGGPQHSIVTEIRDQHGALPCYNGQPYKVFCKGQVGVAGVPVRDLAKVASGAGMPTGAVDFWFYGNLSCSDRALDKELGITANPIAANTTGAYSSWRTLTPGQYSYKAFYKPDAAAQALGIPAMPAECEQLLIK